MASGEALSRQCFFSFTNERHLFIEGSKYREYSVAEEMSTSRSLKMRGTVPFDEQEIYMAENLR